MKFRKHFEEKSGVDNMNAGMFGALVMYTLWYGYKLYHGKDIDDVVTVAASDGNEDFVGILLKNGDRIAYEIKK